MSEARRAAVLQPVTQDFYEDVPPDGLKHLGLSALSELGEVLEDTLAMEILEETSAWPEPYADNPPDGYIMLRFTAYVVPA